MMGSRSVVANATMHTNVDALQPCYQYDNNDVGSTAVQPAIVRFTPSTCNMRTTTMFSGVPGIPSESTRTANHDCHYTLNSTTTAATAPAMVGQDFQLMNKWSLTFSNTTGENTHLGTTRSTNLHDMTLPTTPTPTALQLQLLRSCEESASQPMLIMCENDKASLTTTTPTTASNSTTTITTTTKGLTSAGNASAIATLACDDDDDEDGGVEYNETEDTKTKSLPPHHHHHHAAPPTAARTTTTTTSNTTIPNMTSITPLMQSSPFIGPLPFFNPGAIIHIAETRSPYDVLIGKSQMSKMHVGNVAFRAYVNSRLDHYKKSTRRGFRIAVCVAITNAVFAAGGRFYAPLDRKCRGWEEADIDVARVKVGNSIRDSLKKADAGTNTADPHKFSGSTSFTEIVEFFLQEMAVMDELNNARAIPRRPPSVVIDTTPLEKSRTDGVREKSSSGGGHDSTTNSTTTASSISSPVYKLQIYSFEPRDGARVATLIKSTKKRKRDPIHETTRLQESVR